MVEIGIAEIIGMGGALGIIGTMSEPRSVKHGSKLIT